MQDVLFVPELKKNLLSISALDAKGTRVAFVDCQVLMWPKGNTITDSRMISVQEGILYKLKGHSNSSLVHINVNLCELWHRRLDHLHYKLFSIMRKMVTILI